MTIERASGRAHAYVDGFNLYYGAIKGTPHRWLDLQGLAEDLLRGYSIGKVKYFTAIVDDRPDDPSQSQRQQVFLRALATLPKVETFLGTFRTNKIKAMLVKPLSNGQKFVNVYRTEEKGSDVNLGAHLVWDACHRHIDTALVISNDSDLQTPVDMARELGIEVITVNPHRHAGQSDHLVGDDRRNLTTGRLRRNRLPDTMRDEVGEFACPVPWME